MLLDGFVRLLSALEASAAAKLAGVGVAAAGAADCDEDDDDDDVGVVVEFAINEEGRHECSASVD